MIYITFVINIGISVMRKIYFKDGSYELISDDLLKAVEEFSEVLRNKLGDDSEKLFREIISDTFDYAVDECSKGTGESFYYVVDNPFDY